MVSVRAVQMGDYADWSRLYAGYADFYGVAQTEDMREKVWKWLHDTAQPVNGFVAESGGKLVGLAHYRPFSRPLSATTGCYLDDLFVDPAARGSGAADALLLAVKDEAKKQGWSVVRWITAEDNARARKVYDRLASKTKWVTYDMVP